jgi:hypothetical protein
MESDVHQQLVRILVQWVRAQIQHQPDAVIYFDLVDGGEGNRPPTIGGFTPDVFARVLGLNRQWIGEAKTARDIDTQHSRQQYRTFLEHLDRQRAGVFVLAAPWRVVRYAKSLVKMIQRESDTLSVEVVFLEQLPG